MMMMKMMTIIIIVIIIINSIIIILIILIILFNIGLMLASVLFILSSTLVKACITLAVCSLAMHKRLFDVSHSWHANKTADVTRDLHLKTNLKNKLKREL